MKAAAVLSRITPLRLAVIGAWLVLAIGTLVVSQTSPIVLLLISVGFGAAFLSGLVGVGGAVILIPLLLYVPP
ncbi:MAG: hypothetical protein ABIQ17_00390, partial [Candidatus Limnocylindrales bacterium]